MQIALQQNLSPQKKLGISIRLARIALSLSQEELGYKLSLTQSVISKWERGAAVPDAITMQAIACVLQQPLGYFEVIGSPTFKSHRMR